LRGHDDDEKRKRLAERRRAGATSQHRGAGSGSFTVKDDRSVSGSITIGGLSPMAAHIHVGARGANGPVAIGLTKSSDTVWVVPAGAMFNEEQYKSFLAGNTYVNFHTAQHKGGEIRAQLQP
jgi:hypothetical protein